MTIPPDYQKFQPEENTQAGLNTSRSSCRRRVFLLILDGAGVGSLPDAAQYGDEGAATLPHVSQRVGGLDVPVLEKLGLGNIVPLEGVRPNPKPLASYGRMAMRSSGKDTTTGHWEIAGLILPRPFPLYPRGFPPEITEKFTKAIGRKILGNRPASGTEIIAELGELHLRTGSPIVYTSADSVFQIAAHEEIVPLDKLYHWCTKAREILTGKHSVSRVIARPFTGEPGNFIRTSGRRDYSLQPTRSTMLDLLSADGMEVTLIGKVRDIFDGRGLTRYIPVKGGNKAVARGVLQALDVAGEGLIWANFGDFDTLYGHRNDPHGFARALWEFDFFLGNLIELLRGTPHMLIVTADHGCDPTWPGTDHTREYVPLLVMCFGGTDTDAPGVSVGTRETMSDLGATIMDFLGIENHGDIAGKSFLKELNWDRGTDPLSQINQK